MNLKKTLMTMISKKIFVKTDIDDDGFVQGDSIMTHKVYW